LAFDPNYVRACHLRGLVKEKMGLYEDAVQEFDEAITLNPEYGVAYFSRASLHNSLSHTEEAMADIEMATHYLFY
jgi:tetratricopeptide (TPR) repeat protein